MQNLVKDLDLPQSLHHERGQSAVRQLIYNLPHPTLSPRRGLSHSPLFRITCDWIGRMIVRTDEKCDW
jgi:hypothetical protein